MAGLLRNGSLQADWEEEKSHVALESADGLVWTLTSPGYGNVFNPPGWMTWFQRRVIQDGAPMVLPQPKAWHVLMVRKGLGEVLLKLRYALDEHQADLFAAEWDVEEYLEQVPCALDQIV